VVVIIKKGENVNHAGFDDVKKNFLDIIKKGENVNVCIHDFDDAKEESNKAASKDKNCFKINIRLLQQTKFYEDFGLVILCCSF